MPDQIIKTFKILACILLYVIDFVTIDVPLVKPLLMKLTLCKKYGHPIEAKIKVQLLKTRAEPKSCDNALVKIFDSVRQNANTFSAITVAAARDELATIIILFSFFSAGSWSSWTSEVEVLKFIYS